MFCCGPFVRTRKYPLQLAARVAAQSNNLMDLAHQKPTFELYAASPFVGRGFSIFTTSSPDVTWSGDRSVRASQGCGTGAVGADQYAIGCVKSYSAGRRTSGVSSSKRMGLYLEPRYTFFGVHKAARMDVDDPAGHD